MAGQVNLVQGLLSAHNGPSVSVVIPALNEAGNLPYVLPRIPNWVDEIVLVDGYSTDGTIEVARSLRQDIRIVMRERRGKGDALRAGFAAATGDIIITLDADGSTDPAEIPLFVGALLAGADYVKGSRFLQGAGTVDMPSYRKLGNYFLSVLTNVLFKTRYTDITYGYNATWRHCVFTLALEIDGWANEIISSIRAARCGLRVVEVACFEHARVAGEPKLSALSAGWAILKAILQERFARRGNWIIWEKRTIVGDEVFSPAIQLLRHEVLHLASRHEHLPPQAYQRAVEASKATFLAFLDLETDHPDARQLQSSYRKKCDTFWELLERSTTDEEVSEQMLVECDDEFATAMRLLFHEGVHLVRRRKDLPSRVYQHAVETFKAACQALLDLEAVNPESRLIQEYYRKHCGDTLWSFVELE